MEKTGIRHYFDAVVDGNVNRVLARLFDLHTPINSSQGKKEFQLLADELLNTKQPALHNSAMMEFGALWCKPQNPKCETCALQEHCMAFKNDTVSELPIKNKTIKIKNRYGCYQNNKKLKLNKNHDKLWNLRKKYTKLITIQIRPFS